MNTENIITIILVFLFNGFSNIFLRSITANEKFANKNARTIINTANSQFKNGQINYLEWVLLTNNAISISNDYLDEVKKLNECIIKINSLNNK
jgi:cobalt-zinc-cadmium resistance protein CzcA